ncbi:MAG TPA: TonB-dependent receptor, partial [Deltaproteobacteria bacterium]|nr:TonB-dependent receptor [Deltaproteobacteria bacterium]
MKKLRTCYHNFCIILAALFMCCAAQPCLASGMDDGGDTIELYSAWEEESSSASRSPKPLSQTPENITIITTRDIEAINAHTLQDVLVTIPGIQSQSTGGPGSMPLFTRIQSAESYHLLVLVDGIPINTLGENYSDTAIVPARIIERIEIVKGAASSAWGQALGGVINVITKTPAKRLVSGSASASIGSAQTSDDGLELSGTNGRLGYYLSGGYLGFDGIPKKITTFSNNAYSKLTYDLPSGGLIWGSFNYNHANRTNMFVPLYDLKEDQRTTHLYATLGFRHKLSENLELEISGRHSYRAFDTFDANISDGAPWGPSLIGRDKVYGGSAKLTWRLKNHLIIAGSDYEHAKLSASGTQADPLTPVSRSIDRWGAYLNDTFTIGNLTLTAGARFDRSSTRNTVDQFSPSIGATYRLTDSTLLRGYTARGFGLWALSFDNPPIQKVWTSQIGIESTIVPYLWQKLTLFRNETWDIDSTLDRRIALGTEYEIRTTPVFNTSIAAGYTFTDTKLTVTNKPVYGAPRHTLQLALHYNDEAFRGAITGRHIFWNTDPADNARYQGLIWDLHLGAKVWKKGDNSLELFFSARNIFNGSQTQFSPDLIPYPGRWF